MLRCLRRTPDLPGLFYPTLGFYDDMGRFYTAGIKIEVLSVIETSRG